MINIVLILVQVVMLNILQILYVLNVQIIVVLVFMMQKCQLQIITQDVYNVILHTFYMLFRIQVKLLQVYFAIKIVQKEHIII
jgi:hypothetical protein